MKRVMSRKPVVMLIFETGAKVGLGHLFRCLGLLEAIPKNKFQVVLAGNLDVRKKYLIQKYQDIRYHYFDLSNPKKFLNKWPHQTIAMTYIDTKHSNEKIKKYFQTHSKVLIEASDAKARERAGSDWVLNPNLFCRNGEKKILAGPRYYPLRKSFAQNGYQKGEKRPQFKVLVVMGGKDLKGNRNKLLEAISGIQHRIEFCIILGAFEKKVSLPKRIGNCFIRTVRGVSNISPYLRGCDFCVGATGVTSYEAFVCGKPILFMPLTGGQAKTAEIFEKKGLGKVIVKKDRFLREKFLIFVDKFYKDKKVRRAYQKQTHTISDGKGALRVLKKVRVLS